MADNKLLLSPKYPHSMRLHIEDLLRTMQKEPSWLLEDDFMEAFSEKYADYPAEIRGLRMARKENMIKDFYENCKTALWKQRTLIQKSTYILILDEFKEYEAAEVVESLMGVFKWKTEFAMDRRWTVTEEDRAKFHDPVPKVKKKKPREKDSMLVYGGIEDYSANEETVENDRGDDMIIEKRAEVVGKRKHLGGDSTNKKLRSAIKQSEKLLNERAKKAKTDGRKHQGGDYFSGDIKNKSKEEVLEMLKDAISEILMEDEVSEEEYIRQLRDIEIRHESLMTLSLRREVKKAKRGNALSQYALGEFYGKEGTPHTDYLQAAKWYSFAARQGNLKAKLELGKLFDSEKLVENELLSINLDGIIEIRSTKKYGIRYFQELASEGYPTAQTILGMKYYFGDGVEQDVEKGIEWLKKAALQGQLEAQRQLGDIYVQTDPAEAKRWLIMASASGDSKATRKLASL